MQKEQSIFQIDTKSNLAIDTIICPNCGNDMSRVVTDNYNSKSYVCNTCLTDKTIETKERYF